MAMGRRRRLVSHPHARSAKVSCTTTTTGAFCLVKGNTTTPSSVSRTGVERDGITRHDGARRQRAAAADCWPEQRACMDIQLRSRRRATVATFVGGMFI
jgi:hypothetical protein